MKHAVKQNERVTQGNHNRTKMLLCMGVHIKIYYFDHFCKIGIIGSVLKFAFELFLIHLC